MHIFLDAFLKLVSGSLAGLEYILSIILAKKY